MSAKVLSLTGEKVSDTKRGKTARDVLVSLLAKIDSGEVEVERLALIAGCTVDTPGNLEYRVLTSDMTIAEAHLLYSLGAQMKLDLIMGRLEGDDED